MVALRALGMQGETASASYHQLLNRSHTNMLEGVRVLIKMLLPLTGSKVVLVVADRIYEIYQKR